MTATTKNEWVKAKDAGYSSNNLLLDTPTGHWSVRRFKTRWIATHIRNNIAERSREFKTRREAIAYCEGRE